MYGRGRCVGSIHPRVCRDNSAALSALLLASLSRKLSLVLDGAKVALRIGVPLLPLPLSESSSYSFFLTSLSIPYYHLIDISDFQHQTLAEIHHQVYVSG